MKTLYQLTLLFVLTLTATAADVKFSALPTATSPSTNSYVPIIDLDLLPAAQNQKYPLKNLSLWTDFGSFIAPSGFTNQFKLYTNGGMTIGSNTPSASGGDALMSHHYVDRGDPDWNAIDLRVYNSTNGALSRATSYGYTDYWNTECYVRSGSNPNENTDWYFTQTPTDVYLSIDYDSSTKTKIWPTAPDNNTPYFLGTTITHTTGNLAEIKNNGTNKFTVDYDGAITIAGTTNQVTFGATNTAPVSSAAPTKWISVKVAGESAVYRLPLYE